MMMCPDSGLLEQRDTATSRFFEAMLPSIREYAEQAFAQTDAAKRPRLVDRAVDQARDTFWKLAKLGRSDIAYARPLAMMAVERTRLESLRN